MITVSVSYVYVYGVPLLSRDGDHRYAQTFAYEINQSGENAVIEYKKYLPVGTTTTYTFHDWDPLHATKLSLRNGNSNPSSISNYWNADMNPAVKSQNGYDVSITVSLENRSDTVSNETAYEALIAAKEIVLYVDSSCIRR